MSSQRTNAEVASVFEDIAEILERQGENPFKTRAYRTAVRTLDELNEPVADVAARGELRKLPGFGEAITAKTQEILAAGTCELYERLKREQAARDTVKDEEGIPIPDRMAEQSDISSYW